jgi:FtsP/CotA-like multicopper oxidase with cupredoxin domain
MVNMHIEGHPMHVHLINFQAVKSYSLKKMIGKDDKECSLYMLDYFRFSGLP